MRHKEIYTPQDVFAPKKRRSSWDFFFKASGFLVLGAASIALLYAVFYSPWLKVQEVKVVGAELFNQSYFTASLTNQIVGQSRFLGFLGPDNILFWIFGRPPANLPQLPNFGSLSVQADLFKRSVSLAAQSKNIFGILCLAQGNCYGFDEEGVIFTPVPQIQGSLILRIDDVNERAVVLGGKILPKDEWIENIFTSLKILKDSGLSISSLFLRPKALEEWQANLSSGAIIYFSLNFVPPDFGAILKNLLKRLDLAKLQYLDFRVENRIYYK